MIGWTYDAAGNRLSDGTTTATYDALNRLVTQDGTPYQYNGDGVLVSDGTTTYTQDLAAPLSQILADGSATYVYGAGSERLRTLDGPWFLGDALGSVRTTLDDAGAVVATTSYDPWGTPQGELAGPFGFTGELHHGDQVYLRARWYAPGSGTFPSRDPFAGFPEMPYSLHAYQYAYSAPTMWTDPTGEVIPYCPAGFTPVARTDGSFGGCQPTGTVPPWVSDVSLGLPIPMLGGTISGTTGHLGGRTLGHLGREGLETCINLIGGTLVWILTQTHVDTQTRRDNDKFVRVRHYSRDILGIMMTMTILPNPGMNLPNVIWVEEPITTPYDKHAIKRRTQQFFITRIDGFVEFNVDLNTWSMAQDPNIDYDANSKIIILQPPFDVSGFPLHAPNVYPVFFDEEGQRI